MKKYIFNAIFILLVAAIGGAVFYLYANTSFLRFRTATEDIEKNNFNTTETATASDSQAGQIDFTVLQPVPLAVPEQYRQGVFAKERTLNVPAGFSVSVFAAGLDAPRFFTFDASGSVIVADKGAGAIYLLTDTDRDGAADVRIEVDSGLRVMHSVFYYEGDLYAAEENRVSVYRSLQADGSYRTKEVVVENLPAGGGHSTQTVLVGPDRKLYVSVGSSCNLCEESDARRAAVMRYDLDGSGEEIFASGLRNSVGIGFRGSELWSVDNGRDQIGDDLPPEEVNVLAPGKHYGWPYCYGHGAVNPEYEGDREDFCRTQTTAPAYEMQAHSAPLGMAFVPADVFPDQFADHLIIAFHGSWNRTVRTGYKVVRIDASSPENAAGNFISGWLDASGQVWGRPVGTGFGPDGALYISDDQAGAVYRVTYQGGEMAE